MTSTRYVTRFQIWIDSEAKSECKYSLMANLLEWEEGFGWHDWWKFIGGFRGDSDRSYQWTRDMAERFAKKHKVPLLEDKIITQGEPK